MLAVFRRPVRHPRRFRRGVYLLPSMFTVANMFCGWTCVGYAMRGEYGTAAPFVAFAMILDLLDGRIARFVGSTSDFGVEFDSLADVISFGVAPAILVFAWGLGAARTPGWAGCVLYVTATAMRLARFNVQGRMVTGGISLVYPARQQRVYLPQPSSPTRLGSKAHKRRSSGCSSLSCLPR